MPGTPNTKNLGLVKAIHVGLNPPVNIKMLWYNTNPGENKHYYYDVVTLVWKPLVGSSSGGSGTTYNFTDSNTVDFTVVSNNVTATVKVSSAANNIISALSDGIFAKETITSLTGVTLSGTTITISYRNETGSIQTQSVNIASALVDVKIADAIFDPNTYILTIKETDGTTHDVNLADLIKISTQDTMTVDLSGDGSPSNPLKADVRVSSQPGNGLTILNDGLFAEAGKGSAISEYLPTPVIAKRKVSLLDKEGRNYRQKVNNINPGSWTVQDVFDLFNFDYSLGGQYYVELLDVYFNSFGDRAWLNMPDKKLELVTVSNNNYKHKGSHSGLNGKTKLNLTGKGNKDNFVTALTHPANTGDKKSGLDSVIYDTIFSGGNGGQVTPVGSAQDWFVGRTEWPIDETALDFGWNEIQPAASLNRKNNPNLVISIDVRKFFRMGGNKPVQYPVVFTGKEPQILKIKNIGTIQYNSRRDKVYRRNQVLYFRLSCGVPGTLNEKTGVYEKRLYSDLSIPVYICPRIKPFMQKLGDLTTKTWLCYGHTLSLGVRV